MIRKSNFFFQTYKCFNSVFDVFNFFVHHFKNLIEYLEMAYIRWEVFYMLRLSLKHLFINVKNDTHDQ